MTRQIIVSPLFHQPIEERKIEMCKHKGIGHSDTITDGVGESASRELSKAYIHTYGAVLHHNLDKGLLWVIGSTRLCLLPLLSRLWIVT